jgi:hypothetical protein
MFDKFGEFDSVEELNRAAAAQKAEGDEEALKALAVENGLDPEDAEDYMDDVTDILATPLQAAIGKLQVEAKDLKIEGVLVDWKDSIVELCMEDETMQAAVRKKGKYLKDCLAALLRYSFEHKVQVSDAVVKATKVTHNGREEPMRRPLYLGIPNRKEVKQICRKYYGVEK